MLALVFSSDSYIDLLITTHNWQTCACTIYGYGSAVHLCSIQTMRIA
jgi:hypothetical protein